VDPTVVIAIAGLLTTLAASVLGAVMPALIAARNKRKTWLRDQPAAVYADALAYIQATYQVAENLTQQVNVDGWKPPDVLHQDLITARMRLFADPAAFNQGRPFVSVRMHLLPTC